VPEPGSLTLAAVGILIVVICCGFRSDYYRKAGLGVMMVANEATWRLRWPWAEILGTSGRTPHNRATTSSLEMQP
jgi:hypothetical protein